MLDKKKSDVRTRKEDNNNDDADEDGREERVQTKLQPTCFTAWHR